MTDTKVSIRFFEDREVRAIWDDENSKWWFSVLDVVGVLNQQDDYEKSRNYWKYLKTKLKKENNELVSVTNQLKIVAPDGKKRLTDVLDSDGVNGRTTRIWLDLMLKKNLQKCVDWSQIDKKQYLDAMTHSVANATIIKSLLQSALTDRIADREMFMKGIDYSYYYEEQDETIIEEE